METLGRAGGGGGDNNIAGSKHGSVQRFRVSGTVESDREITWCEVVVELKGWWFPGYELPQSEVMVHVRAWYKEMNPISGPRCREVQRHF